MKKILILVAVLAAFFQLKGAQQVHLDMHNMMGKFVDEMNPELTDNVKKHISFSNENCDQNDDDSDVKMFSAIGHQAVLERQNSWWGKLTSWIPSLKDFEFFGGDRLKGEHRISQRGVVERAMVEKKKYWWGWVDEIFEKTVVQRFRRAHENGTWLLRGNAAYEKVVASYNQREIKKATYWFSKSLGIIGTIVAAAAAIVAASAISSGIGAMTTLVSTTGAALSALPAFLVAYGGYLGATFFGASPKQAAWFGFIIFMLVYFGVVKVIMGRITRCKVTRKKEEFDAELRRRREVNVGHIGRVFEGVSAALSGGAKVKIRKAKESRTGAVLVALVGVLLLAGAGSAVYRKRKRKEQDQVFIDFNGDVELQRFDTFSIDESARYDAYADSVGGHDHQQYGNDLTQEDIVERESAQSELEMARQHRKNSEFRLDTQRIKVRTKNEIKRSLITQVNRAIMEDISLDPDSKKYRELMAIKNELQNQLVDPDINDIFRRAKAYGVDVSAPDLTGADEDILNDR